MTEGPHVCSLCFRSSRRIRSGLPANHGLLCIRQQLAPGWIDGQLLDQSGLSNGGVVLHRAAWQPQGNTRPTSSDAWEEMSRVYRLTRWCFLPCATSAGFSLTLTLCLPPQSIWSSSMMQPGPSALEQLLLQQKQKQQRGHGAMNPPHWTAARGGALCPDVNKPPPGETEGKKTTDVWRKQAPTQIKPARNGGGWGGNTTPRRGWITTPTPLGCQGAVTPLLDRRARDLFDRGATHHATARFHSTGGNLNIEEPPPLHITAPPLWTDATSPRTRHLEELLLLSLEKDKKKIKTEKRTTSWTSARSRWRAGF